jgi:hypothetical protein
VEQQTNEYIANELDNFAKHLQQQWSEVKGTPQAFAYKQAITHLIEAAMWLRREPDNLPDKS